MIYKEKILYLRINKAKQTFANLPDLGVNAKVCFAYKLVGGNTKISLNIRFFIS